MVSVLWAGSASSRTAQAPEDVARERHTCESIESCYACRRGSDVYTSDRRCTQALCRRTWPFAACTHDMTSARQPRVCCGLSLVRTTAKARADRHPWPTGSISVLQRQLGLVSSALLTTATIVLAVACAGLSKMVAFQNNFAGGCNVNRRPRSPDMNPQFSVLGEAAGAEQQEFSGAACRRYSLRTVSC